MIARGRAFALPFLHTCQLLFYTKEAYPDRIDTQMTLAAIDMAYRCRKPNKALSSTATEASSMPPEPIGNSWKCMAPARVCPAEGDPYGNAVAENFFNCLICELVHLIGTESLRFSPHFVSIFTGRAHFSTKYFFMSICALTSLKEYRIIYFNYFLNPLVISAGLVHDAPWYSSVLLRSHYNAKRLQPQLAAAVFLYYFAGCSL